MFLNPQRRTLNTTPLYSAERDRIIHAKKLTRVKLALECDQPREVNRAIPCFWSFVSPSVIRIDYQAIITAGLSKLCTGGSPEGIDWLIKGVVVIETFEIPTLGA
jgi:hypothetical protein